MTTTAHNQRDQRDQRDERINRAYAQMLAATDADTRRAFAEVFLRAVSARNRAVSARNRAVSAHNAVEPPRTYQHVGVLARRWVAKHGRGR